MIQIAKRNNNWRYKYPECPGCKAIGAKGLTTTKYGNLLCRNCRSMFTFEWDKDFNIKVGKSMGN